MTNTMENLNTRTECVIDEYLELGDNVIDFVNENIND